MNDFNPSDINADAQAQIDTAIASSVNAVRSVMGDVSALVTGLNNDVSGITDGKISVENVSGDDTTDNDGVQSELF